jgi:succinoglycan biosynthesis protein ExoM
MRKVAIGVTTFQRPKLLMRSLEAIAAIECEAEIHVFVADNCFEKQEGVAVARKLRDAGFPFSLEAFAVSGRGFTFPRNALLSRAFEQGDFEGLAIVDDDQRPEAKWLQALIEMQDAQQADIVAPVVKPEFEAPPALWAQSSKIYFREASANGLVSQLSGDGGILLARRVAGLVTKPWYNHAFGLTGGADADLFLRLQRNGARFARARDSVIHEFYPASRQSLAWALKRAYRIGNSTILIELQNQSKNQVFIRHLPKMTAGVVLGPAFAMLCLWSPRLAVDMLCKTSRNCGKLTALMGSRYLEYEHTHGV